MRTGPRFISTISTISTIFTLSTLLAAGCGAPEGEDDETGGRELQMTTGKKAGADCKATTECAAGLYCSGIPADGSTMYGKCTSTAHVDGESLPCSATVPCKPGLSCALLLSGAKEGWCEPSWMFATYQKSSASGAQSLAVVAYGLATVPVDIVVQATVTPSSPSKLSTVSLTLRDPNGVVGNVCSPTRNPCTAAKLAAGISAENSRDDAVNGRWILRVTGPGSPKLKSFTLKLSSRMD